MKKSETVYAVVGGCFALLYAAVNFLGVAFGSLSLLYWLVFLATAILFALSMFLRRKGKLLMAAAWLNVLAVLFDMVDQAGGIIFDVYDAFYWESLLHVIPFRLLALLAAVAVVYLVYLHGRPQQKQAPAWTKWLAYAPVVLALLGYILCRVTLRYYAYGVTGVAAFLQLVMYLFLGLWVNGGRPGKKAAAE